MLKCLWRLGQSSGAASLSRKSILASATLVVSANFYYIVVTKSMDNKYLFIKWFIVFAVIMTLSLIAAHFGLFTLIFAADASYISFLICVLFLISSLITGKLSYDMSNEKIELVRIKRKLKLLNFISESFFTLGLLGTIIGFCLMMSSSLTATIGVAEIITQLKIGSSTALYTTLVGICASLALQIQVFLIECDLVK